MKNETKEEKFKRIAQNRTNKIVDQLRLLGNCSNRSVYEYSKEDVKKIFSFIEKELKICKERFEKEKRKKKLKL